MKVLLLFVILILFISQLFGQEIDSRTFWPYTGVLDENRRTDWMKKPPLIFIRLADFDSVHFRNPVNFECTKFDSLANFNNSCFFDTADFKSAQFHSRAEFRFVRFHNSLDFVYARFYSEADFRYSEYDSLADFNYSRFYGTTDFELAEFHNPAFFLLSQFDSVAIFKETWFASRVIFDFARFDNGADFRKTRFNSRVYFNNTKFKKTIFFNQARFNDIIDLRDAQFFDETTIVDFSLAIIPDTVLLGVQESSSLQRYDFMRAKLIPAGSLKIPEEVRIKIDPQDSYVLPERNLEVPGSKIILFGPVDLKIQIEKFKFLELCDTLDYYAKKDIISVLNEQSFENNKAAKFELEYLFAKSTMYQKVSVDYETYPVFHPVRWWRFLYSVTMGQGYRPFRLIYWVLFLIVSYSIFYMIKIPDRIDEYIRKEEVHIKSSTNRKKSSEISSLSSRIIHCLYFSSTVFFTFRLKRDILTFFNDNEKRIIISQWLLGFMVYLAFLTLSKAGSILQNLKDLFIG